MTDRRAEVTATVSARPDAGRWEECEDNGCGWDFQFSSAGHIERTFWSLLALARAVNGFNGDGATYAFAGRWHHGYSGISPRTGERVACDEDGVARLEWDEDADDYTTGCTKIQPTTWVTMPEEPERRVKSRG